MHWGKNSEGKNNFSISGFFVNEKKEMMTLRNHAKNKTQNYLLNKIHFQKPKLTFKEKQKQKQEPKTEYKDISKEFNKLEDCKSHPYIKAKQIKIPHTTILKQQYKRLIIGYYPLGKNFISGWQNISHYKNNGQWKKWVKAGHSNKAVYLPI